MISGNSTQSFDVVLSSLRRKQKMWDLSHKTITFLFIEKYFRDENN